MSGTSPESWQTNRERRDRSENGAVRNGRDGGVTSAIREESSNDEADDSDEPSEDEE
jgi:hypothetical protein